MDNEQRRQIIDIWKTIVEVQQHFNDISMRIRGMFVTILLALFAAIGFLLSKPLNLKIWIFNLQFATILPLFGIFGTWLFYFMDRYWYHRLLVGSVKHAIEIEQKYENDMPELSLGRSIRKESPYKPGRVTNGLAYLLVSHQKYKETGQLHSDAKIELFYKSVVVVLAMTMIILALLGGVTVDKKIAPTLTKIIAPPTAPLAPQGPPAR